MPAHTFDTSLSQDYESTYDPKATGGLFNDQPGGFPVGVAERIDGSKEHVRHVRAHSNNTLIKKQVVQENMHFGPLIGTFALSRQNLFIAF